MVETQPRRTRRDWALAALLVAVTLTAYFPTLSAGFVWDDDAYVVENPALDDGAGLRRIWLEPGASPQYYPMVFTTFWIERQVFGTSAPASHAVNIGLHIVNALLVWVVLRRLDVRGAFVAALVFAVHPVHVESVAWVTERKNVLSGAFALSSLMAYWTYACGASPSLSRERTTEGGGVGSPERPPGSGADASRAPYAASLVLFALALLSKSVTATLPIVLALLVWWRLGTLAWKHVRSLLPMAVLGAAMGLLTAWLEVHHVGAMGDDWVLSPAGRAILAGRVLWFYAAKLAWPHPLMFTYPRWNIDPSSAAQSLFTLSALAVFAALWTFRSRLGRGPLVAALVFAVSLLPVLGFLNVYPMRFSYVADHFQYLASISLIAIGVAAVAGVLGARRWSGVRPAVATLVVVALVAAVRVEARKFRDVEALWVDTIAKNPAAWLAHVNLGNLHLQQGKTAEAKAAFEAALRAKPGLAVAHNGLGIAVMREGDMEGAERHLRAAVEINPGYAEAHNNVGLVLMARGRSHEAVACYREALTISPEYGRAHYNLANALARIDELDNAEFHYREALRLEPQFPMAHFRLGLLLLRSGRASEADEPLRAAFALQPAFDEGYVEVGNVALAQGDTEKAIASYRAALRINPEHAPAYCNLGAALLERGEIEAAVVSLQRALALRPGYPAAENNLGSARERQGRPREALEHYRAALRADPDNTLARGNLERLERVVFVSVAPVSGLFTASQPLGLKSLGRVRSLGSGLALTHPAWSDRTRAGVRPSVSLECRT